jgi:hypothetical protein
LKALRINTSSRACVVGVDELEKLIGELRSLSQGTYSEAGILATVLEAGLAEEMASPELKLGPDEEEALGRALNGLEVSERRLSDGLQCLYDGFRIDRGTI